ncbi:MAG: leucine-rich repeat domain-containing protein [Lachnospiraceae bacterium]|nr:leucine-rich repeat domain-containing protein [Lachnospiraceae bacterium]
MNDLLYPSFAYEKKEDGAVILRCFSRDGIVQIPERIGGLPVRELGAYAFSAHMDAGALEGALYACESTDVEADSPTDDGCGDEREPARHSDSRSGMPAGQPETAGMGSSCPDALCGNRLEEIVLPQTVRRVGRYCFYNCGNLRRLEFPGSLKDWESGVFTGCHRVKELCVHANPEDETGLKQVLDELPEELRVEFRCIRNEQMKPMEAGLAGDFSTDKNDSHRANGKNISHAILTFPEFYEEGVENTPARILETHVHGTGIRYRNCFQGKRFDFALYDSLFPYARAQENLTLLTELVLGRLRFPCHLGEQEKKQYEAYVRENANAFGRYFLDQKDPEGLQWFLERFAAGSAARSAYSAEADERVSERVSVRATEQTKESESLLDALSEYAARHGDALSQSRLMEFRRRNRTRPASRKRLGL